MMIMMIMMMMGTRTYFKLLRGSGMFRAQAACLLVKYRV
jgi:hypothetical protein